MEIGSSLEFAEKVEKQKGQKVGSMLPKLEPFVPKKGHDPRELRSWAKRTGFVSTNLSGESGIGGESERDHNEKSESEGIGLEKGQGVDRNGSSLPKTEFDPVRGRTTRNSGIEIEPVLGSGNGNGMGRNNGSEGGLRFRDGAMKGEAQVKRSEVEPMLEAKVEERRIGLNGNGSGIGNGNGNGGVVNGNGNRNGVPGAAPAGEQKKIDGSDAREVGIDVFPDGEAELPRQEGWSSQSKLKCGLRDNPGFG